VTLLSFRTLALLVAYELCTCGMCAYWLSYDHFYYSSTIPSSVADGEVLPLRSKGLRATLFVDKCVGGRLSRNTFADKSVDSPIPHSLAYIIRPAINYLPFLALQHFCSCFEHLSPSVLFSGDNRSAAGGDNTTVGGRKYEQQRPTNAVGIKATATTPRPTRP
jgi:hypothetical protein